MITRNIIGYRLSGLSEKRIFAYDPEAMTTLPEAFIPSTSEEVDEAVHLSRQAWRAYRQRTGIQRASFLHEIASGIEALGNHLISRIKQETAYPEARILSERNRTCAQWRMFAEIAATEAWREITIDPPLPDRTPSPRPGLRKMMVPLGPVIVFGASNFPLAYSTTGGDVASALAVGCPVIVKAHDSHLGTNALLAEVIMQAAMKTGMPEGVFSSLIGDGFETGRQLVEHPLVAAVGFTGSQAGGRALFDLGQKRKQPIPVFAEMGSVNPVFILPGKLGSDPASLASMLAGSMTMTVGQFCTSPGILVALDDKRTHAFIELLKSSLEKVPEATMLNQGIHQSFHKGVMAIRDEKEIRMIHDPGSREGHQAAPVLATVPASVFMAHPHLHQEIFGPFSLIVLCEDLSQMMQIAGAIEGQLTATVHALDEEQHDIIGLVDILSEKAGRIVMNGVPTGVEVCAAMTHGGPYPASTDSRFTAVGHHAVRRWIRPVTFQNFSNRLLPDALKDEIGRG